MITAISCTNLKAIDSSEWTGMDVLGIDEGQFFEDVSKRNELTPARAKLLRLIRLFEIKGRPLLD